MITTGHTNYRNGPQRRPQRSTTDRNRLKKYRSQVFHTKYNSMAFNHCDLWIYDKNHAKYSQRR